MAPRRRGRDKGRNLRGEILASRKGDVSGLALETRRALKERTANMGEGEEERRRAENGKLRDARRRA